MAKSKKTAAKTTKDDATVLDSLKQKARDISKNFRRIIKPAFSSDGVCEIRLSESLKEMLQNLFESNGYKNFVVMEKTAKVEYDSGNYVIFPNQYFYIATKFNSYAKNLLCYFEYMENAKELKKYVPEVLKSINEKKIDQIPDDFFYDKNSKELLKNFVDALGTNPRSEEYLGKNWTKAKGTDIRGDKESVASSILALMGVSNASSNILGEIFYLLATNDMVYECLRKELLKERVVVYEKEKVNFVLGVFRKTLKWDPNFSRLSGKIRRGTRNSALLKVGRFDVGYGKNNLPEDNTNYDESVSWFFEGVEYFASKETRGPEMVEDFFPAYNEVYKNHFRLEAKEDGFRMYEMAAHASQIIYYGAPGTGKSYILNEKSEVFKYQERVVPEKTTDEFCVKAEVAEAITAPKGRKLTKLNSIGFKYADFWKDRTKLSKKEIQVFCGDNKTTEIYVGAVAKFIADSLNITDEELSDIEFVKNLLHDEKARGGNDKLKWANAIGYKMGKCDDYANISLKEIESDLGLKGRQILWLYRGVQAALVDEEDNSILKVPFVERVTFHPNYSYAQFVGTYKPVQDDEDDKLIKYEYVPGPFMRVYRDAKKNPNNDFLLIIEEINRANVAAVFGDIFQLLDRKNGESEYPVAASEDVRNYLDKYDINERELCIPSNMYIWATMNSADQGVFPMDTAFKRRWEFKYIDVDQDEKRIQNYLIPVNDANNQTEIKFVRWNALRKRINAKLTYLGINEDKLMGPFFISLSKLEELKEMLGDIESLVVKKEDYIEDAEDEKNLFENNPKVFSVSSTSISEGQKNAIESFRSAFCGKVLMYLFEDAAKMRKTKLFNTEKIGQMRFSNICNKFADIGLDIFDFSK